MERNHTQYIYGLRGRGKVEGPGKRWQIAFVSQPARPEAFISHGLYPSSFLVFMYNVFDMGCTFVFRGPRCEEIPTSCALIPLSGCWN